MNKKQCEQDLEVATYEYKVVYNERCHTEVSRYYYTSLEEFCEETEYSPISNCQLVQFTKRKRK
jgi:hypothetical protein